MNRICKHCGKEFKTYPSQIKLGWGNYCSNSCSNSKTPLYERLVNKITKLDETSCWEFNGSKDKLGYGKIKDANKLFYAHRIVFEMNNGKLNKDTVIEHTCKNNSCCNPKHLICIPRQESLEKSRLSKLNKKLV